MKKFVVAAFAVVLGGGLAAILGAPSYAFEASDAELARLKAELVELKLKDADTAVADIDVELLQRALKSLGLYDGDIDNEMTDATRDAIRAFQARFVDGEDMSDMEVRAITAGELTPGQTVALFERAAEGGHDWSQYVYGVMFFRGIGVPQSTEEAIGWLERATAQDHSLAHYVLGQIYSGKHGPDADPHYDPEKSDEHFIRSCRLGYRSPKCDGRGNDFPVEESPSKG